MQKILLVLFIFLMGGTMSDRRDEVTDFRMPTKRLIIGEGHESVAQMQYNRMWSLCGMNNPCPVTPGLFEGWSNTQETDGESSVRSFGPLHPKYLYLLTDTYSTANIYSVDMGVFKLGTVYAQGGGGQLRGGCIDPKALKLYTNTYGVGNEIHRCKIEKTEITVDGGIDTTVYSDAGGTIAGTIVDEATGIFYTEGGSTTPPAFIKANLASGTATGSLPKTSTDGYISDANHAQKTMMTDGTTVFMGMAKDNYPAPYSYGVGMVNAAGLSWGGVISTSAFPTAAVIDAAKRYLYVGVGSSVIKIDLTTKTVVATITVPYTIATTGMVIAGNNLYCTSYIVGSSAYIMKVNLSTLAVSSLSVTPPVLSLNTDGSYLFYGSYTGTSPNYTDVLYRVATNPFQAKGMISLGTYNGINLGVTN